MPTDVNLNSEKMIYQRDQYEKGGVGRTYWDFRDEKTFSYIPSDANVILDVGCGEGITLEKMINLFPNKKVWGIDLETENIEICHRNKLPIIHGSVYDLPFADNSVDCVVFMEVIEHLNYGQKAISEIYRILKPGGRFIMVFPNDRTFFISRIMFLKFQEAFYETGHVCQYTFKKLKKMVKKQGFHKSKTRSLPINIWNIALHGVLCCEKK